MISIEDVHEGVTELKRLLLQKEKPFLPFDEAVEYLGISRHTLYAYTSKRIIPHFKPQGRRIYFRISDLDQFILSRKNRVAREEEIEEEAATRLMTGVNGDE